MTEREDVRTDTDIRFSILRMRREKEDGFLFAAVEVGYVFRWSKYTIARTSKIMIATAPNTPPAIAPTFTELELFARVELVAVGVEVAVWTRK